MNFSDDSCVKGSMVLYTKSFQVVSHCAEFESDESEFINVSFLVDRYFLNFKCALI